MTPPGVLAAVKSHKKATADGADAKEGAAAPDKAAQDADKKTDADDKKDSAGAAEKKDAVSEAAEKEQELEDKKNKPFVPEVDPYKQNRARECLRYRLDGTPGEAFTQWGHEYVRHLAGELIYCYQDREEDDEDAMDVDSAGSPVKNLCVVGYRPPWRSSSCGNGTSLRESAVHGGGLGRGGCELLWDVVTRELYGEMGCCHA